MKKLNSQNKQELQHFYQKLIKQIQEWQQVPYNVAHENWTKYYKHLQAKNLTHAQIYTVCRRAWRDVSVKSWTSYRNMTAYLVDLWFNIKI